MRTCTVPNCDRKHHAHDYCSIHYHRWRRHGGFDRVRAERAPICTFPGCERKHYGRALCMGHYQQVYRFKRPLRALRQRLGKCSVPGCERKHYGRGLCKQHWARWHRLHGELLEPLEQRAATLPLAPLLRVIGPDMRKLCEFAGVSKITHGRKNISSDIADKVCIAAGLHPVLVWPDEWVDVLPDTSYCELDKCSNIQFARGMCRKHYEKSLRLDGPGRRYVRITEQEAEEIWEGVAQGQTAYAIAKELCRPWKTVYHFIQRNRSAA